MSDLRKAVLLRLLASAGALAVFGFTTVLVVETLRLNGSVSPGQVVAAYVTGIALAVSIAGAVWLTWLSAYRSTRQ